MPNLFDPLTLGPVTLPNRVVVAPMCQYSADDGSATDWHLQHLMQLAMARRRARHGGGHRRGAHGRITHGCLGLYTDANETALAARARRRAQGRASPARASASRSPMPAARPPPSAPWEGGRALGRPTRTPGRRSAPRPIPFAPDWHTPAALDAAGLERVKAAFVQAAQRAVRIGFEVDRAARRPRLPAAQFTSPLSNTRTDAYGGSLESRMRFPLEVAQAGARRGAEPVGARRPHHGQRLGRGRLDARRCRRARRRA